MRFVPARELARRLPLVTLVIASAATSVSQPWGQVVFCAGFGCSALAGVGIWRATNGWLKLVVGLLFFAGPAAWVGAALKIWFGSTSAACATAVVVWFGVPQSLRSWSRRMQSLAPLPAGPERRPPRKIRP